MERIVTLYEREPSPNASHASLPEALAMSYDGGLTFPDRRSDDRPYVIGNFVETLDGVVSYDTPGQQGGGFISGESEPDHFVMGLLRARADAVIFGSGSLHLDRGHVRTPGFVYPPLAEEYAAWRTQLGKRERYPLSVVVSGSGQVNLHEPTFTTPELRVVLATTTAGAAYLRSTTLPPHVDVRIVASDEQQRVAPGALLALLRREYDVRLALHEGGPLLLTSFLVAGTLDELFLTFAPQMAGRIASSRRTAIVEGYAFTPATAPWARLLSVKRAGEHLLLRYALGE